MYLERLTEVTLTLVLPESFVHVGPLATHKLTEKRPVQEELELVWSAMLVMSFVTLKAIVVVVTLELVKLIQQYGTAKLERNGISRREKFPTV